MAWNAHTTPRPLGPPDRNGGILTNLLAGGTHMDRRQFLAVSAGSLASAAMRSAEAATTNYKLRISPVALEIGPGKVINTVGYNGSVPGPVLHFAEGKAVTVDVFNDTGVSEVVHW